MTGQPFHIGCRERTTRARVQEAMYAPGVWTRPQVWDRPDVVMFSCPTHGLVPWHETRYELPPATATQLSLKEAS